MICQPEETPTIGIEVERGRTEKLILSVKLSGQTHGTEDFASALESGLADRFE